ncbi:amidohydrolase-domain-containing protein [Gautieria morchelliformis]|nr:amidohydrolase-domain-containing protein [Gautieria morchelliformis]
MPTVPETRQLKLLEEAAFCFPIIDNHTHNLLKEENRSAFAFEGLTSEASGEALKDATSSIAFYRAIGQLAQLYGCEPTLEAVKKARDAMDYERLCQTCMSPTGIVSLLLDDGMDRLEELCYDYKWHDRFASTPSKRIVRVETVAQNLMKRLQSEGEHDLGTFSKEFENLMVACCNDQEVVGFKSVACYRTGLDIMMPEYDVVEDHYNLAQANFKATSKLRLAYKPLNDFIVRLVLDIAGRFQKPVQFHTGLGDNDISLETANPAVMQSVIKEFPQTVFVLLHSSYPFSQEAGYLATVYHNVYLDFGEVFPIVSRDGQLSIIRQVLELTPTSKILWSTDGHWWPETYYLAVVQVRDALYEVLADYVAKGDMTESQAVAVVEDALFHNSNRIYKLGLSPQPTHLKVPIAHRPR